MLKVIGKGQSWYMKTVVVGIKTWLPTMRYRLSLKTKFESLKNEDKLVAVKKLRSVKEMIVVVLKTSEIVECVLLDTHEAVTANLYTI